jgi:hypothetical protein
MKIDFKIGNAEKVTKNNACTNVPIQCPECPAVEWRYNLKYHLQRAHPGIDLKEHRDICEVIQDEIEAMKKIWSNRMKVKGARKPIAERIPMKISTRHSTLATLR